MKESFDQKYPELKNLQTYWGTRNPSSTLKTKAKSLFELLKKLSLCITNCVVTNLPFNYMDTNSDSYKKISKVSSSDYVEKIRKACVPSAKSAQGAGYLPKDNTVGTSHVYNYMKYMFNLNKNKPKP